MANSLLNHHPKPTKHSLSLLDDYYNTPSTSLLSFRFEPNLYASTAERLQQSIMQHASIEGKDVYTLDRFFTESEGKEMRTFAHKATFSRNSYGSPEAIERGELPAKSMNGKERWQFFSNPPHPLYEMYKLFGLIAHHFNVEVTTLPWELCDQAGHGSSSVLVNLLKESSHESMHLGKHKDCNPEKGVSFGIPILYPSDEQLHPKSFINGAPGNPWLVSVMLYTTAEDFLPHYQMGTVFYIKQGDLVLRTQCLHMRLVLFEGDIIHSIEESKLPPNLDTWRISHVFKLILNPKIAHQSIKQDLLHWLTTFPNTSIELALKGDTIA